MGGLGAGDDRGGQPPPVVEADRRDRGTAHEPVVDRSKRCPRASPPGPAEVHLGDDAQPARALRHGALQVAAAHRERVGGPGAQQAHPRVGLDGGRLFAEFPADQRDGVRRAGQRDEVAGPQPRLEEGEGRRQQLGLRADDGGTVGRWRRPGAAARTRTRGPRRPVPRRPFTRLLDVCGPGESGQRSLILGHATREPAPGRSRVRRRRAARDGRRRTPSRARCAAPPGSTSPAEGDAR